MVAHGIDLDTPGIRAFRRKWKIGELCVFGSYLRDDFRPDSDIDLLVEYDTNARWDLFDFIHMEDELATILGRKVDLIDRCALERSGNKFIKQAVLSSAEPIREHR